MVIPKVETDVIDRSLIRHDPKKVVDAIKNNKHINIEQLDEFREINLGVWEGQTQFDIKAAYPAKINLAGI